MVREIFLSREAVSMTERSRRRVDPMVLVRGLPGHPLHPPLTHATIGRYVLASGLAIIGYAGAIKLAAGKGMWLALTAARGPSGSLGSCPLFRLSTVAVPFDW
jgi:hypothetical protein